MTQTYQHSVAKYERHLRSVKGGDYVGKATIKGMEPRNPGDVDNATNMSVRFTFEMENGYRVTDVVDTPSSWDLTSRLVVLMEYFGLEPEEFSTLSNGELQVPVEFNHDEGDYEVAYDRMREIIIDDGGKPHDGA